MGRCDRHPKKKKEGGKKKDDREEGMYYRVHTICVSEVIEPMLKKKKKAKVLTLFLMLQGDLILI